MPNLYGTLTQIRARLIGLEATTDDSLLMDNLEDASRLLDRATHRHFYPKISTRYYDSKDTYCLEIDDGADLLSVTTLTTYNDDTTIASSDYFLACGESYNTQPYNRIVLDTSEGASFGYSGTPQKANKIIGVWGYHDDYTNAHVASGATVNETFSDSDTTLTVSNGALFERGQTIRIESEWLYVSAISSNNLTVERGVNGSTAASHASGTAITIYKPMRDVERVALRLAAWLYRQLEAPFTFEVQTGADGQVIIPPSAPPEVHRFVKRYRRAI